MRRFVTASITVLAGLAACDDTSDTQTKGLVDGSSSTCPTSASCPSFASDIFPSMKGSWKCSDATCHGGGTFPPVVDDSSASACLASLKKITIRGKPYITESKTPDDSSLLCNVKGACGEPMPKDPAPRLSSTEVCKLEAWLRCGAPP